MLADALYGSDYQFRRMLEKRGQAYVLAIRSNHVLRFLEEWRFVQTDRQHLSGDLEAQAWQPLSAGEAQRDAPLRLGTACPSTGNRRRFRRAGCWRAAACATPTPSLLTSPMRQPKPRWRTGAAAGLRWTIEECFCAPKTISVSIHGRSAVLARLDRHMSLVMAAAAFLAGITASSAATPSANRTKGVQPFKSRSHDAEILATLHDAGNPISVRPAYAAPRLVGRLIIQWSRWRRQHQFQAAIAPQEMRT